MCALLTVLTVVFCFPAGIKAASSYKDASAADGVTPVSVLASKDADKTYIAEDIPAVRYGGRNMLCLPGSAAALSDISLVYTGEKELYLPDEKRYIKNGDSFTLHDFKQSESIFIYEYDISSDSYRCYETSVKVGSAIPALYITLPEGEHPGYDSTLDWLNSNKKNSTSASLIMTDGEGRVMYSNGIDKFKGRGNTSFVAPGMQGDKKSFSMKLSKKAELIEGAGKMKKWALLHMRVSDAYYFDFTGLCSNLGFQNYTALTAGKYFGLKSRYTDVFINGEYRGAYILTERLDNGAAVDVTDMDDFVTSDNPDRRTTVTDSADPAIEAGIRYYRYTTDASPKNDFDITGGYLMEVNFKNLEECGFVTSHGMYVDLKSPEAATKAQVQYIAKYVQEFENALYSVTGYNSQGKHYTEYADCESLAELIATYAFFENWELFRTSTYIYKEVDGGEYSRLTFGPAWDFETGDSVLESDRTLFGKHNVYADTQQYIWLEQLWQKGDFMSFMYKAARQTSDIMGQVLGITPASSDILTVSDILDGAQASLNMNWARWDLEKTLDGKSRFSSYDNSFDGTADRYVKALNTRYNVWAGLWNAYSYNFGAYVTGVRKTGTHDARLYCSVSSRAALQYQWYKVSADRMSGTAIAGATGSVLDVAESGEYYCVVTGANNAYWSGAAGSVFSSNSLSVASAPVSTDILPEADELGEMHIAGEWEIKLKPTCIYDGVRVKRCTVCTEHEVLESEQLVALGHDDGEWKTVKEATETSTGRRVRYCTRCGKELESEEIPKVYVNHFKDVRNSAWYAEAVKFVVTADLFKGTSSNTFSPDLPMTRGMLVTVLARLDGSSEKDNQPSGYSDVKVNTWYTGAVVWATKKGIVKGIGDRKFAPDDNVTREQTVTILMRYASCKGSDVSRRADLSKYTDADKIHSYAREAFSWANAEGIIRGMSATTLSPLTSSTRAQAAEMLRLFCAAYSYR